MSKTEELYLQLAETFQRLAAEEKAKDDHIEYLECELRETKGAYENLRSSFARHLRDLANEIDRRY